MTSTSPEPPTAPPVRVLLVDDSTPFLRVAARLLEASGRVAVLGVATSPAEALERTFALAPEVVLLDVAMPDGSGIDLIPHLRRARPDLGIILVTLWPSEAMRRAGIAAGADAVIAKETMGAELLPAIVRLHEQLTEARALEEAAREDESDGPTTRLLARSEGPFRALADHLPAIVWTAAPDGKMDYLSHGWLELTGMAPADTVGHGWQRRIHAEDLPDGLAAWAEARRTGLPFETESRIWRASDETWRWHVFRGRPMREADGRIVKWLGTAVDDHDRMDAEIQWDRFFQFSRDMKVILGPDGRPRRMNQAFLREFGYDAEELSHRSLFELADPGDRDAIAEQLARIAAGADPPPLELRLSRKDGSTFWAEWIGTLDPRDGLLYAVGRVTTERKRTEEQLKRRADREALLLQSVPVILYTASPTSDFTLTWTTPNVERSTGYSSAELATPGFFFGKVHPSDRETLFESLPEFLEAGSAESEFRWRHADGSYHHYLNRSILKRDEHGVPTEIVGSMFDVTERRRAEALVRAVTRSSLVGILISDSRGGVYEANDTFLDLIGYTRAEVEAGAVRWDQLTPPEHARRSREAVEVLERNGVVAPFEKEYFHKDGHRIPVLVGASRIGGDDGDGDRNVAFVFDQTERARLAVQLQQIQRIEAIGMLSGSIAHDFNNILGAILANAAFLIEDLAIGDPRRADAEDLFAAAQRGAGLTRQLLAFSRQQVLEPRIVDLNAIVVGVEKLLRRLIGDQITLRTLLADGLDSVRADPGQIEQVIMNLAVNARDAMPEGGTLTIETALVEIDRASAADHPPAEPGTYVRMAVTDTGCGMDAATQRRIFEPFFTTKERGKGTGLGLSTTYGIVKQSGGYLWVDSEPGRGTVFEIYLPRVASAPASEVPSIVPGAAGGSETILLVEDDDRLRPLTQRMLEAAGYRVLAASNATQALALWDEHGDEIQLLASDVIMPGQSGVEVAALLRLHRPSLKVLLMSGYTNHTLESDGLAPSTWFLQKPFTSEALTGKVREALS